MAAITKFEDLIGGLKQGILKNPRRPSTNRS